MVLLSVVILFNQIFYFIAARGVYENAQWNIFQLSIDAEVQKFFSLQEEFIGLIKVNLLVQMLIFLGYFMFVDYEEQKQQNHWFWYAVDGGLLLGYFIASRIGYVAARSRAKQKYISAFLLYLFGMQAYEILKFWPLLIIENDPESEIQQEKYAIVISQVVIGVSGIATQIYTTYIAKKYYNEVQKLPEDTDFSSIVSAPLLRHNSESNI